MNKASTTVDTENGLSTETVEEMSNDLDKATTFLQDIIAKIRFNCTVIAKQIEQDISIEIKGKDAGQLIGYRGETLDGLQYLANVYVNADKKERVKISVDAENYRRKRTSVLENLAKNLEKKVIRTNRYVKLEPMNASDRKIIHSVLQDSPRVRTESQGDEPNRFVVIYPKVGDFSVIPEPVLEDEDYASSQRKKLTFVYRSDKKRRR